MHERKMELMKRKFERNEERVRQLREAESVGENKKEAKGI